MTIQAGAGLDGVLESFRLAGLIAAFVAGRQGDRDPGGGADRAVEPACAGDRPDDRRASTPRRRHDDRGPESQLERRATAIETSGWGRALIGIPSHALYTALLAAGLVYLIGTPAQLRRIIAGVVLVLAAILIHGIWDSAAALGGGPRVQAHARPHGPPEVAAGTITEGSSTRSRGTGPGVARPSRPAPTASRAGVRSTCCGPPAIWRMIWRAATRRRSRTRARRSSACAR
ncbi:PrsW family intramembrane metalloprotease [Solirubrobacter sp. CPCC 204708]|uniref:PrsW family intramembrane metalloprotease n=1 Tax=Solirubrobacter deserti TaxID=2282478 RepID=A0ABT4RDI6_9ACTN|nr:PrsW family glutamic-type intramembrane protease [Solirubrobacter deserti]MBE2314597.1 PrsW family intramembrane metalloprotease [Solirubrobacter deserti]MDA0136601.1 PrsW family intramembrane metalloprotease [Solirubrobacter deserti]